ncbi:MAG: hypothetical protein CR975_01285 [Gammaproteobacteria bacterium]|nr:MAG: hypothetical protein CR975_01285 [Gammaproteobacteria bacterium]
MNKPILFYSKLCPDTAPFVAELERLNINYEPINIFESMANFKQFLRLRDTNAAFDNTKAQGSIGIPALVINNEHIILKHKEIENLEIIYK